MHSCSSNSLSFSSVQGPAHEMEPPTFRVGLTSVNPIKKNPSQAWEEAHLPVILDFCQIGSYQEQVLHVF